MTIRTPFKALSTPVYGTYIWYYFPVFVNRNGLGAKIFMVTFSRYSVANQFSFISEIGSGTIQISRSVDDDGYNILTIPTAGTWPQTQTFVSIPWIGCSFSSVDEYTDEAYNGNFI